MGFSGISLLTWNGKKRKKKSRDRAEYRSKTDGQKKDQKTKQKEIIFVLHDPGKR